MTFSDYYTLHFQNHLQHFFSSIPENSRFHEDQENKQIYSVQYERLTPKLGHLSFLSKDDKDYFAFALYFTVLVDMVFYTYYKSEYPTFQNLTRYPKFIGNCLSGCRHHFHPKSIFRAVNPRLDPAEPNLIFREKFCAAAESVRDEVISFFTNHFDQIDGQRFWERCANEFPFDESVCAEERLYRDINDAVETEEDGIRAEAIRRLRIRRLLDK